MKRCRQKWLYGVVVLSSWAATGCQQQSLEADAGRTGLAAAGQRSRQNIQTDPAGPRLVFQETTYDFGEVTRGKTYTGEFQFTNRGEGILRITDVGTCCGAVATLDREEVAPGAGGTLKVEYDTGWREGLISKQLRLRSNDPASAEVILTLKALIVPKVDCQPSRLSLVFDQENAGCPALTVTSLDQQPFSITAFQSTGESITAEVDASKKATQWVLHPKVDLGKLRKYSGGVVAMTLTHPELDRVTIPFGTRPRFDLRPSTLILLDPAGQQASVNRVSVVNNYGEDFEIESAASEKGIARVLRQRAIAGGYQLGVEITPPPRPETGGFTEVLHVQLSNGETLSLKCYIRYADEAE